MGRLLVYPQHTPWFASITKKALPDIDAMTNAAAGKWLRARWDEWMALREEL